MLLRAYNDAVRLALASANNRALKINREVHVIVALDPNFANKRETAYRLLCRIPKNAQQRNKKNFIRRILDTRMSMSIALH